MALQPILYREETRFTGDIDFIIKSDGNELSFATELLEELELTARPMREGELSLAPMMGKKQTPYLVVIGRNKNDKQAPGVDFLLSANPWVESALRRAQTQRLSYEFGEVPVITAEDVIIAKLSALKHRQRYKDLDDLESIFTHTKNLDESYLCGEIDRHRLSLPRELQKLAPKSVRIASKRNQR